MLHPSKKATNQSLYTVLNNTTAHSLLQRITQLDKKVLPQSGRIATPALPQLGRGTT